MVVRVALDEAGDVPRPEGGEPEPFPAEALPEELVRDGHVALQGRRGKPPLRRQIPREGLRHLLARRERARPLRRHEAAVAEQAQTLLARGRRAMEREALPLTIPEIRLHTGRGEIRSGLALPLEPAAELGDDPQLHLRRLTGVPLVLELGRQGIDVRSQRPLMQTPNGAGIVKEVMDHVSPPCERGSREETPYYAGRATLKWAMDAIIIALPRDSPGPWIGAVGRNRYAVGGTDRVNRRRSRLPSLPR